MFEPLSFPVEYIIDLLKEVVLVVVSFILHVFNHGGGSM